MVHLHFFLHGEMRGVVILTPDEFQRFQKGSPITYTFFKGKMIA